MKEDTEIKIEFVWTVEMLKVKDGILNILFRDVQYAYEGPWAHCVDMAVALISPLYGILSNDQL